VDRKILATEQSTIMIPRPAHSWGRFTGPMALPSNLMGLWDMLVLGDGVYFTAGIADEEHGLFGLITED